MDHLNLTHKVRKTSENRQGQNSDIWYANWEDNDNPQQGALVAVKVVRGVGLGPEFRRKFRERLLLALLKWATLKHPHIVETYGLVDGFGTLPGIVMKKYPESLQHRLASCNTSDNANVKLQWFKDIALGLKFLHGHEPPVLHGDLRCANIFLDDEGRCVIADFGLAFLIDASECTSTKVAGSSRWMAPEIMDPKSVEEHDPYHSFSAASDVFSLAMTAIEIFTGKPPFPKKNDGAAILAVISGLRPDMPESITANPSLAKVVRKCWDQNPHHRPSMSWVCYQLGLTSSFAYIKEWLGSTGK